jgi:uncharacterized protein YgiM (DUF1202 family)
MYFIFNLESLRFLRFVFFVGLISVIIWAALLGIQSFQDSEEDKAIITAQTVTAKSSPDMKSVDAFVIHEGIKVKLTDAVGDWVKITLADGKVGWISEGQCERI